MNRFEPTRGRVRTLLLAVLLLSTGLAVVPQDSPRRGYDRRQATAGQEVMWLKLDLAHDLLEALFMRDIDVIGASLDELTKLSEDHSWFENDSSEFRRRSQAFREGLEEMSDAVREADVTATQSAYFDVLRSCFACHQNLGVGP